MENSFASLRYFIMYDELSTDIIVITCQKQVDGFMLSAQCWSQLPSISTGKGRGMEGLNFDTTQIPAQAQTSKRSSELARLFYSEFRKLKCEVCQRLFRILMSNVNPFPKGIYQTRYAVKKRARKARLLLVSNTTQIPTFGLAFRAF